MDLTAIINGIRQRTAFGVWRLSRIVVHVALHVGARFLPMAEWRSTARAHRSSPFRSSASGHSGYHLFAIKNNPDTNFLITCQTLCTPAAPLYFPTTAPEGSDFPTARPWPLHLPRHFLSQAALVDGKGEPTVVLIGISLLTHGKHLFMCLLALCISWGELSVLILCPFKNWVFLLQ